MQRHVVLEKIQEVFSLAEQKKYSRVKANGEVTKMETRRGAYTSYADKMNTVAQYIIDKVNPTLGLTHEKYNNPRFWTKETVDTYISLRLEEVNRGERASKTLKNDLHALESFRQFSNKKDITSFTTNSKIKIGGHERLQERLKEIKEETGPSSYKDSRNSKMKIDEAQGIIKHIQGPHSEQVKNILNNMLLTGARLSTVLVSEVQHVSVENGAFHLKHQKGGAVRNVPISPEAIKTLKEHAKGKTGGSQPYLLRKNDGGLMSLRNSMRTVERYVTKAAERARKAGDIPDLPEGKNFTVHSFRKSYAQALYDKSQKLTDGQVRDEIKRYLSLQNPKNRKQLEERIEREKKRLNKNRDKARNFTPEEERALLVSLYLSHSRIDVLRYYINRLIKEHDPNQR
ncbi:tyrosine-type recombinase/integrase [Priestia aryabhattai]|uniref:tyrosine-type recombinase/integrase n=1 Tax=Priestia aryabhattai TaxID=412384 RepID=UPI002E2034DC|nr:tyrosine-type recombinase/integrase [Priestia aryabhattai]MED3955559.1 tyrosine-type recombinase/integrase [Priestia aryabhattai]